ncbi:alpha/beta fold hydrolase [Rathayibacter sp. CAU 1779]
MIAESGEGDADRSVDLVDVLAEDFTVLTYDRRGLSRSRPTPPSGSATMSDHAEDLHHLLKAVADGPVSMLGLSIGAVIGLHLAVRHPEQLDLLVAHEPVAPSLLPETDGARQRHELSEIQSTYVAQGLFAAVPLIRDALGIVQTPDDAETGLTAQPLDEQRRQNFDHFIRNDFTAVIEDELELENLREASVRVVPAVGEQTPPAVYDHRCAIALAGLLGTPIERMPGGHNGNLSHPRAFAAKVRALVSQSTSKSCS